MPSSQCFLRQLTHSNTDEAEISQERLDRLAAFQLKMIKHAMACKRSADLVDPGDSTFAQFHPSKELSTRHAASTRLKMSMSSAMHLCQGRPEIAVSN